MKKRGIRTKEGIVSSYNPLTHEGTVSFKGDEKVGFHSTCFQSAPPTRFPNVGEPVEVTFSDGVLLIVRSASK